MNRREKEAEFLIDKAARMEERAKSEIAKYQNIATKARQELAGARKRFDRKLKQKTKG